MMPSEYLEGIGQLELVVSEEGCMEEVTLELHYLKGI